MHETGRKLLNLMFRPDERVCVSNSIYGYHSIPLEEALSDKEVTLVPTQDSCYKRKIEWIPENFGKAHTDNVTLVALNPINGFREDQNVTAYRSFLIEIDTGSIKSQLDYIKQLEIPYSAIVFSGNKSLHCLITLDQDLPNYEIYYHMAEWALKSVTLADQNTKNPSRSIRIPGATRDNGKKQLLVEFKGPTPLATFAAWLAKHPEAKPETSQKRTVSGEMDFRKVKPWVHKRLVDGTVGHKNGRNKGWYSVAFEFALSGYDLDDTIDKLGAFFSPENDFGIREWKTTIKSAFKNARNRG